MDALVSTQWLADHLHDPDLRLLDATWFLPGEGDASAAFEQAHLPGACFFDIDAIADRTSDLPTMLPPASQFAEQLGSLGVGAGDRIVLYDGAPHHTSARAWWMLQSVGIDAAILDGGLAKWRAEGRPLESGAPPAATRAQLTLQLHADRVRSLDQVRANLDSRTAQLVDARSAARFAGSQPEPRPGLSAGHIPGSANIPYATFFNPDGTWKHVASLRQLFEDEGVEVERPVIATCGSGITAATVVFALHLLGHRAALYDGSWAEWGQRDDTPKAKGAA